MDDFNQIHEAGYNDLNTDYKAEIIAYNIWKNYKGINGVFLKRLGSHPRSFHKDVKRIRPEYIDVKEKIVSVESYREGIYDYLPEGIFHPPSLKKARQNITEVVEQIRYEKRVEQKGRMFFQPFELEVYFSHLKALDLADSFDGIDKRDQFLNMLEELWPLLKLLDDKNARIFACLLPYFHASRGKKHWLEKCLSAFLKIPVNISFTPNKIIEFDHLSTAFVVGEMRLGLTCVLAENHFDGEKNWKFTLGPIAYEELHLYAKGSPLMTLLNTIYEYCLPITTIAIEELVTLKNEHSFRVGNKNNSVLGYSTYL